MFLGGLVIAVIGSCIVYIDLRTFLERLFSDEIIFAIKLTLATTIISTGLCMLLAIPAAYALSRYRFPFASVIDTLIDLPIVLPPVAAGIALLVFFGYYVGDTLREWGLTLAHTQRGIIVAQFFPTMTFAVRTVKSAFDSVNPRLEQVARTLGSRQHRAFLRITLPLARNGIVAAGVITWARCLGLFGPVMMFCGATRYRTEILPVAVFLDNSVGRVESAIAVTLILLIIALVALVVFKKLGGRGYLW